MNIHRSIIANFFIFIIFFITQKNLDIKIIEVLKLHLKQIYIQSLYYSATNVILTFPLIAFV